MRRAVPRASTCSPRQTLRDITILRHAGIIFGEEVVGMSTDFADYFSQLTLAPSMLWMHIVHWAGLEGVPESALGAFVLDERLGFGALEPQFERCLSQHL